ncbi:flavin reductase family protein [Cellulomonas sp. Sa3CUA2]|uniref:Flavin reductase family protein n=1 Tax=Cellulomonas avistercoris TaxID=2762242 RepID=A0ABR8Q9G5_9CELL|nr:flavin reductase family protein [Cellulomonas avistercoris]MBD7917067.1 flavin reductase family protein [Cellulomonas avistercoris]
MSQLPTFVTVVTSYGPDGPLGCTVNSLMSLSLDPPSLVLSLGARSRTAQWLTRGTVPFAVNALTWPQRALADTFAAGDAGRRFDGVAHEDVAGCPVLTGAAPVLVCVLEDAWPVHDHVLLVGRVEHASSDESQRPLVHHRRAQRTLALPT